MLKALSYLCFSMQYNRGPRATLCRDARKDSSFPYISSFFNAARMGCRARYGANGDSVHHKRNLMCQAPNGAVYDISRSTVASHTTCLFLIIDTTPQHAPGPRTGAPGG